MSPSLRGFRVLWIGQLVSTLGTGLTGFALGVWIYRRTGSPTAFAVSLVFMLLPGLLVSPLAGVAADRWHRRTVMLAADAAAALNTLAVALLFFGGRLELWHVYAALVLRSVCNAMQEPAFSASVTLLVPPSGYVRASGLVQSGQAASRVLGPLLAGVLVERVGFAGVFLIDFATFLVSLATLLRISVPDHREPGDAGAAARPSLWDEALYGARYIAGRPAFVALLGYFALVNLALGVAHALVTPLVLSLGSAAVLGGVMSLAGGGMLVGSLALSAWGGPRRRMDGILGAGMVIGLCLALAGAHPSVGFVAAGLAGIFFALPFINGCDQALWQAKVPPAVQGRVFATRSMTAMLSTPLGYLVAGPLAERVFPRLLAGSALAAGNPQGRAIGLLFVCGGALIVAATLAAAASPAIRRLEERIADWDAPDPPRASVPDPAGTAA